MGPANVVSVAVHLEVARETDATLVGPTPRGSVVASTSLLSEVPASTMAAAKVALLRVRILGAGLGSGVERRASTRDATTVP